MFRVCVDKENNIYKHFRTEEQAIAGIRSIIESDPKFTYQGAGSWSRPTKTWTIGKTLRWIYKDGDVFRTKTKRILTTDIESKMKAENAHQKRIENLKKEWEEIQKLFKNYT